MGANSLRGATAASASRRRALNVLPVQDVSDARIQHMIYQLGLMRAATAAEKAAKHAERQAAGSGATRAVVAAATTARAAATAATVQAANTLTLSPVVIVLGPPDNPNAPRDPRLAGQPVATAEQVAEWGCLCSPPCLLYKADWPCPPEVVLHGCKSAMPRTPTL